MHVIITGPDNSGKTTLMNLLREETLIDMDITFGKASVVQNKEALNTVVDVVYSVMAMNSNTIWDRWYYPSDLIYGPIVEGYKTPLDVEKCIKQLHDLKTIFVVVTASPEVLKRRYANEEYYYANLEHILDAAFTYEDFCENSPFPIIRIDTSNTPPEQVQALFWEAVFRKEEEINAGGDYRTNSLFRAN